MSEELLHPVDTIGNTYTDIGADTTEGYSISSRSREMARQAIGDTTLEDRIRQRCSIAVGDFGMADLMTFNQNPVTAGLKALAAGAPIYTDIRMVLTGIQKKGHTSQVICVLDLPAGVEQNGERTRTSAGFLSLREQITGSIIVIGNAPSALLVVCDMIREGIRPALVIGTPVGFVNAAESKDMLRTIDVPSVSNVGTRGGTPIAVAAMNEIITIFASR
ncbi:MAG TPA: precorrin-8X methylmutase [Methanospirillum sp.]|nr:precorrin-8X methylmutase [Methanospirillum sp.]